MPAPVIAITRAVAGDTRVPGAEVRMRGEAMASREELLSFVRGSTAVVTMYTDTADDAFLDAAGPQLRGVCNYAVGFENIDLGACRRRGVAVTNTPHVVTEGTADLAWTLLLGVARGVVAADRYARSPAYPAGGPLAMNQMMGLDLTGRTLLIVGAGRIGFAVAARSIGWGMEVLYVARERHREFELAPLAARRVTLEEGLALADAVSVHTPLTPQTRHLINAQRLALMKPTAILINTSRGPVVEEAALAAALKAGRLYGAGLDVYEHEPRIHPDLLPLDNVVLTPHIGSSSRRYRLEMTAMALENAGAIVEGREPPNRIA